MREQEVMCNDGLQEGTTFYKHKYPSINIERMIEHMSSFEEFEKFFSNDLMDENLLLADYLWCLLDRYGKNPSETSSDIGKHESYLRKIVNGEVLNPSRDVLLAVCVYLGTSVEETQNLLKYAGKQPLYARRKRDAIVWFALKKRHSREYIGGKAYLSDLNNYLVDHGFESLIKIITKERKEEKEKEKRKEK